MASDSRTRPRSRDSSPERRCDRPQPADPLADLTPDQRSAADALLAFLASHRQEFVLTGYAGSGKSFTLVRVLQAARSRGLAALGVAAPTHKACEVLRRFLTQSGMGGIRVETLARVLSLKPVINYETGEERYEPDRDSGRLIDELDALVVDEASMVSATLLAHLRSALADRQRVVFVGDPAQLPPVGELQSPALAAPQAELTDVIRNAGDILQLATDLRQHLHRRGSPPLGDFAGDESVRVLGAGDFAQAVEDAFLDVDWAGDYNADRNRIVCFTNRRAEYWNGFVHQTLYGDRADRFIRQMTLVANKPAIDPLERSILVPNNAEVEVLAADPDGETDGIRCWRLQTRYAGTLEVPLLVVHEDPANQREFSARLRQMADRAKALTAESRTATSASQRNAAHRARRDAWRSYYAFRDSFADLRYPYALTVHKSQGSTFDRVWIDLPDIFRAAARGNPEAIEQRNRLLYVAVTRASQQVTFLGFHGR